MHATRTLPLTAALVTAALLCAGCSSDPEWTTDKAGKASGSPTADPAGAVRDAVAATRATSAHTDQRIVIDAGATGRYEIDVTGGFDLAADRGTLKVHMAGKPGQNEIDEVFADGKVHVSDLPQVDPGTWATMPRAKTESHYTLRAPVNDPEYLLQQIAGMSRTSEVGRETVGGVRTTHYRGTLDNTALTRRMASEVRAKTDEGRKILGSDLPVFADAWIDAEGRVTRTRTDMNLAGVRITVTLNLTDHGTRVTAEAPEPAVPVTELSGVFLG
ncbi:hypothetical protein ABZ930_38170 [Streptomyces sp. NPDC046716]|uniref:hypothetical protein n=1 Tax=Streptomyces sp. NPDC046716 TaxID=3157093 RepID=UPI0033FC3D83